MFSDAMFSEEMTSDELLRALLEYVATHDKKDTDKAVKEYNVISKIVVAREMRENRGIMTSHHWKGDNQCQS